MRRFAAGAALAASLVLSGCLGGGASDGASMSPTGATPPSGTTPATPGAGVGVNETTPSVDAALRTIEMYLTADHALDALMPAEGFAFEVEGFVSADFASGRFVLPPWTQPGPNDVAYQVTAATLHVTMSSDSPQASLGPAIGGDAFAWIGEPGRNEALLALDGPDHLAPGDVATMTGEFALSPGGIVIPKGGEFAILFGLGYSQSESAPMKIHVGGAEGSRVTLEYRSLPTPATKTPVTREESGTLSAEATSFEFPVAANSTTFMIEAVVDASATAGVDADVAILSPAGDVMSASTSPHPAELARAMRANLDEGGVGEYVVRVTLGGGSTGGQAGAPFTLRITTVALA